jgi:hypothetical protein
LQAEANGDVGQYFRSVGAASQGPLTPSHPPLSFRSENTITTDTVFRASIICIVKVHPAKRARVVGNVSRLPFASLNPSTSRLMSTKFKIALIRSFYLVFTQPNLGYHVLGPKK